MADMGVNVPAGVSVTVLFDTVESAHLVIPLKPLADELSDEDFSAVRWAYESNSGPSGGSRRGDE